MTTLPPTQQQSLEFTTRHSFSYRDGANNKYHLKDSLEIDNSLANLLEKKLEDLYKFKKAIKYNHIPDITDKFKNLFNRLDTNGDGQISKTEFWKFFTDVVRLNIYITKLFPDIDLSNEHNIQTLRSTVNTRVKEFKVRLTEEAEAVEQFTKIIVEEEEKLKKLDEYLKLYEHIITFNTVFNVTLFDVKKVEDATKDELVRLYGMLDENFDNQLNESEIFNCININASTRESEEIKNVLIEIFELLVKKISIMIDLANIKSKLQHEYEADDNYDFDTQKNHLKYLFHSLEISEKFLLKLKSTEYETINLQNDIRLLLDIHLCISIEDERPIKQMTGCYNAIYKPGEASTETNVILSAKYDQDMPIDKTDKSGLNNINNLLKLLDELQSFIYIFLKNEINLIHVLKECKLQLLKTKEKLEILRINFFKSYIKEKQFSIEGSQAVHHIQVSPIQSREGSVEPLGRQQEQFREGSVGSSQQSRDQTPKKGGGGKKKKKKSMEFKF